MWFNLTLLTDGHLYGIPKETVCPLGPPFSQVFLNPPHLLVCKLRDLISEYKFWPPHTHEPCAFHDLLVQSLHLFMPSARGD